MKDVIDKSVIKQPLVSNKSKKGTKQRREYHHLCLDRAYQSKPIEQEIIKRGYFPHIPYKRKRGQMIKDTDQKRYYHSKNKRWVVAREQTLGIIGSESCLLDMKRRLRIIWAWCNYHAVSLSIER